MHLTDEACQSIQSLVTSAKNLVELLTDSDEGCPLGHLLELAGPGVGAGGPDAAQHVQDRGVHVASVGHLHRLALAGPEQEGTR